MTFARYIVFRMAQALGHEGKNRRPANASSEMGLLKKADSHVGKVVWCELDGVGEYFFEYENLRELSHARERGAHQLGRSQPRISSAHKKRAGLLGVTYEPVKSLLKVLQTALDLIVSQTCQRDEILEKAQEIRRIDPASRTKLSCLSAGGAHSGDTLPTLTESLFQLHRSPLPLHSTHLLPHP